jgi:hypothetical protein
MEKKMIIEKKKKNRILLNESGFAWEAAFHTCETALYGSE